MTYVETLTKGKKEYYYLTKNIRINLTKWRKIRVYIGDKKPTTAEIKKYAEEIEKRAEKEGLTKSE